MDTHWIQLIIMAISMMYWLCISVDAWKIDTRLSNRSSTRAVVTRREVQIPIKDINKDTNNTSHGSVNSEGRKVIAVLNANRDILYACPLNSMCQCTALPNQTSILIEINCNEVSLYKFPELLQSSIRHIEISKTQLQSIEDETFQGLRLETLKLIDNRLEEVSEKSFSSMSHSILALDLSGNELQQIPLAAIRSLHSLSRLFLQRNFITSVDGNWGSLTENLRSLHLSRNCISEIPAINNNENRKFNLTGQPTVNNHIRPFSKLHKLVWLDLHSNRISHLIASAFPKSVITLDLSSNLLTTFPQQLFENLRDLRIVSLRDNLIRSISCGDIRLIQMHLDKLDLSLNSIKDIQPNYFQSNYSSIRIRSLNLEKNFIKVISSKVFNNIEIVHLVLAFNEINKIHIDAFEGITHTLEYLDLERNKLSTVPAAIKTLENLKYLYLTSNHINTLTNLPNITNNLRVLSLSGNNFTEIPYEVLKSYTELSYLNIGYNIIAEIQDFSFVGWGSELQTLLLRNNKITQITQASFAGLNSIKEISLSFNDIHYAAIDAFENISRTLKILELSFGIYRDDFPKDLVSPLTQLMWLGLDNNNLKTLEGDSISTLQELSYINLSFNRIVTLPRGFFDSEAHKHLIDVDLSFNLISKIVNRTFDGLGELQIINLSSNKIKILEKYAFHGLPYLSYIDLSYNKLKNISEMAIAFLPSLRRIDFTYNSLCFLSLRMFHYVSNNSLPLVFNVSHNRISVFDDDLSSNLFIENLDCSYNLLTNSLSFTNLGSTLRYLNLRNNMITVLGNNAFGDLFFLEKLNLAHNNLTSLRRRSFQGLIRLQELDLSNNRLDQLQVEQFSNLKKLRILNLRNNKLRMLPREVFLNTRLEFLDISNNYLSVWPVSTFSDVGFTLRNIQFAANNLEYLDSSMFVNSQFVFDLNLSKNKITVLPDNTFSYLNNLTNLDLSYNPLVTSNLKEVFLHTPRIRKLNIRGMGLYVLPYLQLPFLSNLDISSNYIQEIHSFHHMSSLRILNVSFNKIMNLSSITDHLPLSVKILDISNNPIRKMTSHDLTHLKFLEEFVVLQTKILNPTIFSKLRSIKKLWITMFSNLGEVISRLLGLQELRLHVIESILRDDVFEKLENNTKLNYLEIYGHNLHTITSNAFLGLRNTQKLKIKIHHTKITDLPPGIFYNLNSVSQLTIDVSNNRLNSLSPDSFYPNASSWDAVGTRSLIGGLDIINNPLECDCGLVWLGHWLRRWIKESTQINVLQKDELHRMVQRSRANTCYDPATARKLSFLELFPEDLLCHASALSSSAFFNQSHIRLTTLVLLFQFLLIV